MKFFLITFSSEEKTIGFFPQVSQGKVPVSIYDPRYISAFLNKVTDAQTLLPELILYKRAKLTDLLSVSYPGITGDLVVSHRLASMIRQSRYIRFQFLSTKLYHNKGQTDDVIVLHPYEYSFHFLDVSNTRIAYRKNPNQNLHFADSEELVERLKTDDVQVLEKPLGFTPILLYSLLVKPDAEIDCFALRNLNHGGIGFVVSEKLKDQITSAGCTGLNFIDTKAL